MELNVRAARESDADFLVWVMMTAATSHLERCVWSTLCGFDTPTTEDLLRLVLRRGPLHWCHLDRFLVAELDGEPAAAASRFDPMTEGTHVLTGVVLDAVAQLGVTDAEVAELVSRSLLLDAATPKDYADAWGVENVAVRPEHRGRGAVDQLLSVALDEGRAAAKEHAQIMCLVGNDSAQRAWERNGFAVRADYRSSGFADVFGSEGMKLLVQAL